MRMYITVVLGLALISFLILRIDNITKSVANKKDMLYPNIIGGVLELVMTILAIIFTWRI